MPDLEEVLKSAMTELERKEQIGIWYKDVKKILTEAREREYEKIKEGLSRENAGSVKNRFDMYFFYLEYFFEKSQK